MFKDNKVLSNKNVEVIPGLEDYPNNLDDNEPELDDKDPDSVPDEALDEYYEDYDPLSDYPNKL